MAVRQRHGSAILPQVGLMANRPVTHPLHDVRDLAAHLPVTSHPATAHRGDVCNAGNVRGGGVSCQRKIWISLGALHPATRCHYPWAVRNAGGTRGAAVHWQFKMGTARLATLYHDPRCRQFPVSVILPLERALLMAVRQRHGSAILPQVRLMVTRPVTCHLHGVRHLHCPATSHPATVRLADGWVGFIPGAGVYAQFEIELIRGTARQLAQYSDPRGRQRHGSGIFPQIRLMATRPVTHPLHDVRDLAAHLPVPSHPATAHRGDVCDAGNARGGGVSCQLKIWISLRTLRPATRCHYRWAVRNAGGTRGAVVHWQFKMGTARLATQYHDPRCRQFPVSVILPTERAPLMAVRPMTHHRDSGIAAVQIQLRLSFFIRGTSSTMSATTCRIQLISTTSCWFHFC
jgi:hypothetical protein